MSHREQHLVLVDELRAKLSAAALGGPERSRERHVGRGKLLPRDRVDGLLDPGSPYLEIGQLDDREITTSLGKRLLMVLSPFGRSRGQR